jgi:hypothetical protein
MNARGRSPVLEARTDQARPDNRLSADQSPETPVGRIDALLAIDCEP